MSRLLLDTHIVLWWFADSPRLTDEMAHAIEDPANDAVVSAVSAFEVATKRALGKLAAPNDLAEQLDAAGFGSLPVTLAHGFAAGELPLHHRDPFDRLLVAQAKVDGYTLVTADRRLSAYDVPLLPAG
ncbi:MAG: type II toxin-antitoxin system VapC family toxin [Thermocrispum sp.]